MHGHVSASTRRQGTGVSQGGLADPNEAAGAACSGAPYSTSLIVFCCSGFGCACGDRPRLAQGILFFGSISWHLTLLLC
jgi:hypothetical protein